MVSLVASGGFTGTITENPALGAGSLIAKGVANGSTCTSSGSQISNDSTNCSRGAVAAGVIPPASSQPTMQIVQAASYGNTVGNNVTSLTLNLGTPTKTGDFLVLGVVVANAVGATTVSIADSAGNSWQVANAPLYETGPLEEVAIYDAPSAASITSVTATFGATSVYPVLYLYELTGVASSNALDVTGSNYSNKNNVAIAVATGATTTTNNDFALTVVGTGSGDVLTASGWTVNNTYATSAFANGASEIMGATGIANFTTTTKDSFVAEIATFKVASPISNSLSGTEVLSNVGTVNGVGAVNGGACGALGASDHTGNGNAGLIYNGVTGGTGPFVGGAGLTFDGSSGWIETTAAYANPSPVSVAGWFKTTGEGTIIGATNAQGNTGQTEWDRQLWVDNAGNVVFGVYNPTYEEVVSPGVYNNGAWHLAVGTIGAGGEKLYIDGNLVATNSTPTAAQNYTAYWHLGWGSEVTWPNAPTSAYWSGGLADVAVFPVQLNAANITALFAAGTSQASYVTTTSGLSPTVFWPLQGSGYLYPYGIPGGPGITGPTFPDLSGNGNTGTGQGGVTTGVAGPYSDGSAASFNGTTGYVETTTASNPQVLTEGIWFKTTGSGVMLGLTNQQTDATPTDYDRAIWIDSSGQVVYGDWPGAVQEVVSPLSYNNGQWHQAVAEVGPAGEKLYVDGQLVASNAAYTTPQNYSGWWHIGYGNETVGWTNPPSSNYFPGSLVDAFVYGSQLTTTQVSGIWGATSQGAEEGAILALSPTSFWTMSGSSGAICDSVGISVQETSGGSTNCLFPAGGGPCPTLTGSGGMTLAELAGQNLTLGSIVSGGSVSLLVTAVQEGAVPSYLVGLHPSMGIDIRLTLQSWAADLHYGEMEWSLG